MFQILKPLFAAALLVLLAFAVSLAMTGCATPAVTGYDPSKYSAEQLKALAEQSLIISCTRVVSLAARATELYIQLDKETIPRSGGTINSDGETCTTTINLFPPIK